MHGANRCWQAPLLAMTAHREYASRRIHRQSRRNRLRRIWKFRSCASLVSCYLLAMQHRQGLLGDQTLAYLPVTLLAQEHEIQWYPE